MTNSKRFISFSGGIESSTLCVIFGGTCDAIFADTGFEHKKMYERIDSFESQIRQFHNNDFKIIRLKSKEGTLQDYIKKQKFYPSFNARFCTRKFKIEPIDDFLKSFEKDGAELMIGLNFDEAEKRTGNHGNLPFVKYSYPLIENKITREKCHDILYKTGLLPYFPVYMKRGGCVGCFYKSKREFEVMVHLSPDEFDQVIELEESIQDKREEFYSIRKDIGPMRKFKQYVLDQQLMFDPSEIYGIVNNETKCGVFCNR